MSRIEITDATGVTQLAGDAEFPDGLDATGLSTPDVATGNSDPVSITTGDTSADLATAGAITIHAGSSSGLTSTGGDVIIQAGEGTDADGELALYAPNGDARFEIDADGNIGFYNVSIVPRPQITGALSAVVDANAKAVLTSIIAAVVALGLATDGTT